MTFFDLGSAAPLDATSALPLTAIPEPSTYLAAAGADLAHQCGLQCGSQLERRHDRQLRGHGSDNSASVGTMNLVLAGTGTHTFDADSGRTITVASPALLQDKAGEAGTLNKAGAGTLILQGTNTHSGVTTPFG